jgi:hypothetical protein
MATKLIIKNDDMTQEEIQASIDSYLKQNHDYDALYGQKGLDIISELLSGFGSYISYNNQTLREETHVETVKSVNSIAIKAIDYSYRINRPTSPKLLLEYSGADINIFRGDSFGSYGDMQLVYNGESRKLLAGSTFEVSVGYLKTKELAVDKSKNLWTIDLEPSIPTNYVEDTLLYIESGTQHLNLVKRLEDLYLGNAVDYSLGDRKARIFLWDNTLSRGARLSSESNLAVTYLEVPGAFTVITGKLAIDKNFKLNTILSQGADADNMYYVKSILPFFNQTFRTAVSPADFNYIVKTFKYFNDAGYQFDNGTPVRYKLRLVNCIAGQTYSITLSSNKGAYYNNSREEVYEVTATEDDTFDTLVARFTSIIESQTYLTEILYPSIGSIFRIQAFKASSEMDIVCSPNVELTIEVPNRLANQYLGYIYYTHRQIAQGIKELTYYEQQQFQEFFEPHKIAGSVVALVPATLNGFNLDLQIKLLNSDYSVPFQTHLENYLSQYQYSINKDFSVSKALRDIALFSYNGVKYVTEVFSNTNESYVGYIERYLVIDCNPSLSYNS